MRDPYAVHVGTKRKTPEVLDAMIEHVRYETTRAIDFVVVGNAWCKTLGHPLRTFTEQSVLEAGLIHFRNLIEFLGNEPKGDRVVARDYLQEWDWTIAGNLERVWEVHGRLAHLGTMRHTSGGFDWAPWLEREGPVVLRGVRDFLLELRRVDTPRYDTFEQPDDNLPPIGLLPVLNHIVGAPMTRR